MRNPNAGLLRLPKSVVLPERPSSHTAEPKPIDVPIPNSGKDSSRIWPSIETARRIEQFSAAEKKAATTISSMRKDRALLQDLCTLGVEVGARELNDLMAVLNLLNEEISDSFLLLLKSEKIADESNTMHRQGAQLHSVAACILGLWNLYKSIIGIFTAMLEKSKPSSINSDRHAQTRAIFGREIETIAGWIGLQLNFFASLHESVSYLRQHDVNSDSADQGSSDFGFYLMTLQSLYLGLGDLSRYKEIYAVDSKKQLDFRFAWSYYSCAFMITSPTGQVHKKLATLAKAEGKKTTFIYHLFCSWTAQSNPFNARDILLDSLEKQRSVTKALSETHALSNLTAQNNYDRFIQHLLSCVCIAVTRTGADTFSNHLDLMRRHLSALLQLHSSGRSTVDSPTAFDCKSIDAVEFLCSLESPGESYQLDQFQNLISAAFTIALAALAAIAAKGDALYKLSAQLLDKNLISRGVGNDDESVDSEVLNALVVKRLNDIRAIPGFIDAARLVCTFIICITGGTGLGLYASHYDDKEKYREFTRFRMTLQSVSIFLDWFYWNELYHILPIIDHVLWKQLEAALQSYFSVLELLLCSSCFTLPSDSVLAEDIALRGFSPLNGIINQRFASEVNLAWWSVGRIFSPMAVKEDNQCNVFAMSLNEELSGTTAASLQIRYLRCRQTMKELSRTSVRLPSGCSAHFNVCERNSLLDPSSGEKYLMEVGFADNLKAIVIFQSVCLNEKSITPLKLLDCSVDMLKSRFNAVAVSTRGIFNLPGFSVGLQTDKNLADKRDQAEESDTTDDGSFFKIDDDSKRLAVEDSTNVISANLTSDSITDGLCEVSSARPTEEFVGGMLRINLHNGSPTQTFSAKETRRKQKAKKISEIRLKSDSLYASMFPGQTIGVDRLSGASRIRADTKLPIIILDVPNIAMRHGLNSKFSCLGIRIVFDFFLHVGHKVVGFLPVFVVINLR